MTGLPRLKILILTPQVPYPPEQGTSLRNYHIIRGLALDHEVHLLSFREEDDPSAPETTPLDSLCAAITTVPVPNRTIRQRLWRLLVDPRPDMAHRLQSRQFESALADCLAAGHFDVVQIEGIELASMLPVIRRLQPECVIVFDDHNAEAELQRRMFVTDLGRPNRWLAAFYSFIQWRRLRRFERKACRLANGVSVVSEADRNHLLSLAPELDPEVVPNCIDLEAYRILPQDVAGTFAHDLLFIGKMDYRPNVDAVLWFAREIWPIIRKRKPSASWAIVGKRPHSRLNKLAGQSGIRVTGSVPDIKPYLASGRVYVMPFRIGSGTRLKLIEAFAAGLATVSTTVGAEGYPLVSGRHLLIEDQPEKFASAVVRLLQDEKERARLGHEGRQFATRYDWRRIVPRFNRLYGRLGLF